jgi:UPF0716 family protein affecting phage T7 exclusion
MTARYVWPLLLVAGIGLMVPFEGAVTRTLGMACLIAFVVWGVFLIATPDYLRGDE